MSATLLKHAKASLLNATINIRMALRTRISKSFGSIGTEI
jgi:hypothetical protein